MERAKSQKQLKMTDKDLRRPSEVIDQSFEQQDEDQKNKEMIAGNPQSPGPNSEARAYPKYFSRFPERPISGYVKFAMKTQRPPIQHGMPNYDPFGKQFIKSLAFVTDANSRKIPIKGFNLSKKSTPKEFFTEQEDNPDYTPNFEVVKKRINAGVLSMETIEARKGFEKPSLTKNEAFYAYEDFKNANNSHIFRKTRLVKLDKNLPRELDPTSGLPSFLQKTRPSSSTDHLKR